MWDDRLWEQSETCNHVQGRCIASTKIIAITLNHQMALNLGRYIYFTIFILRNGILSDRFLVAMITVKLQYIIT